MLVEQLEVEVAEGGRFLEHGVGLVAVAAPATIMGRLLQV